VRPQPQVGYLATCTSRTHHAHITQPVTVHTRHTLSHHIRIKLTLSITHTLHTRTSHTLHHITLCQVARHGDFRHHTQTDCQKSRDFPVFWDFLLSCCLFPSLPSFGDVIPLKEEEQKRRDRHGDFCHHTQTHANMPTCLCNTRTQQRTHNPDTHTPACACGTQPHLRVSTHVFFFSVCMQTVTRPTAVT